MANRWMLSFSAIVFSVLTATPSFCWTLPDTGQHKCYDNSGEIPCPNPGEDFYGQDAQYLGAEPAYQDNGDGTVTDLNTGLVWQKADDGVERTWSAAIAYCEDLSLGGLTGWRLPELSELFSIADFGRYHPAINPVFDCRPSYYWSGTAGAGNSVFAWLVGFHRGHADWSYKSYTSYVRCVREGP